MGDKECDALFNAARGALNDMGFTDHTPRVTEGPDKYEVEVRDHSGYIAFDVHPKVVKAIHEVPVDKSVEIDPTPGGLSRAMPPGQDKS